MGGSYPEGNFMGGNCLGDSCPGGNVLIPRQSFIKSSNLFFCLFASLDKLRINTEKILHVSEKLLIA